MAPNRKPVREDIDPEVDARHDHLITELESSEGHTSSTLRWVSRLPYHFALAWLA